MKLKIKILIPQKTFLDDEIDSLTVKLTSGYRTILPGHTTLIGTLAYAPMKIVNNGVTKYFALHGGEINIKHDEVVLLSNAIEAVENIDLARAEKAKLRALERLELRASEKDVKRASLALSRALARIETCNLKK